MHTRLPGPVRIHLGKVLAGGAPTTPAGSRKGSCGVEWDVDLLRGRPPSQNRRQHLEWMGTWRAWRGGVVHPEREPDLSLGFECSEIEVGTAFLCGDDKLGVIPTCWIELILYRASRSARRPAICVNRRSQAVGNAITSEWTRAAGEGRLTRGEARRGVARPRRVCRAMSGAALSWFDDDRRPKGPPVSADSDSGIAAGHQSPWSSGSDGPLAGQLQVWG